MPIEEVKKNRECVRRSHKIIELLAGRHFDGMSNKELSQYLGTNAVSTHRDLATLEELGYVKKLENNRFVLTSKPLGIFQAYKNHYENIQTRMVDANRSIHAIANQLG